MILSPLEHFELNIFTLFYNEFYDLSVTSGGLYLLSLLFFLLFYYYIIKNSNVILNKSSIIAEYSFDFLLSIFKQQVISVRAQKFFPLIFVLFFYIFLLNFSSLFVFGVSLTGHILITGYLSFSIFLSLFIIGLLNFGQSFFKFFVPSGVPQVLLDFIILIEVFSFAIRPFSLSIRLFANMLAGHTLMGIFSKSCAFIMQHYFFFFLIPLVLVVLVFTLEIAVSIIQAYIFVSLVCIYLNDVYNLH
jgi:F-type H+-transporting ATPase subunit a